MDIVFDRCEANGQLVTLHADKNKINTEYQKLTRLSPIASLMYIVHSHSLFVLCDIETNYLLRYSDYFLVLLNAFGTESAPIWTRPSRI